MNLRPSKCFVFLGMITCTLMGQWGWAEVPTERSRGVSREVPSVLRDGFFWQKSRPASRSPVSRCAVSRCAASCCELLEKAETQYNIPSHLLKAVALTESGRAFKGSAFVPWPWTLNVDGKGFFFSSKAEAIKAAKQFQKQGVRNIDVGCMQISLSHHPNAFRSLEEAFDPERNIRYGAQFLKRLKKQTGQWHRAIAHYHSADPERHTSYRQKVLHYWKKARSERPRPQPKLPNSDSQFPLAKSGFPVVLIKAPPPPRSTHTRPRTPLVQRVPALTYVAQKLWQTARAIKTSAIKTSAIKTSAIRGERPSRSKNLKSELLFNATSQTKPHRKPPLKKTLALKLSAQYHTKEPHLRPFLTRPTFVKHALSQMPQPRMRLKKAV